MHTLVWCWYLRNVNHLKVLRIKHWHLQTILYTWFLNLKRSLKKILAFLVLTAFTNVTTLLLSVWVPVQQNNDWTPSTMSFAFWSSHPTPLSLSRWDCLWFIWTHSSSKWKTLGFCPLTAKCLGWGPVSCVMGEWFQNSRMTRLIHLGNCPGFNWEEEDC